MPACKHIILGAERRSGAAGAHTGKQLQKIKMYVGASSTSCRRMDMDMLQESLSNHGKPALIAFQFYKLLIGAGYDDEEIVEIASALEDIVS